MCQKSFAQEETPSRTTLAPEDELKDPKQFAILKGQVGTDFWAFISVRHTSITFANQIFVQVLDRDCVGIGGATVEVWYAGGKEGEGESCKFEKCSRQPPQLSTPSPQRI